MYRFSLTGFYLQSTTNFTLFFRKSAENLFHSKYVHHLCFNIFMYNYAQFLKNFEYLLLFRYKSFVEIVLNHEKIPIKMHIFNFTVPFQNIQEIQKGMTFVVLHTC